MSTLPPDTWDQVLADMGYIACRTCEETHRPPECDVDGEGFPLALCGCRWEDWEKSGCTDERHNQGPVALRVLDSLPRAQGAG